MPCEEESIVREWLDHLKDLRVEAKKSWIHDSVLSLREVGLTYLPPDIHRPDKDDSIQELVIPFDHVTANWLPRAVQDTADRRKKGQKK